MSETRKSDYLGDVFGDWTVVEKVAPIGDRKRRWVVENSEGTRMEVLQTGLSDLKLAKRLADGAATADAARQNRTENGRVLTVEEAEADLYARLDKQIAEAKNPFAIVLPTDEELGALVRQALTPLVREAIASVALDNDPDVQTLSFTPEQLADNPFDVQLSASFVDDPNECTDCLEGNHPDLDGELSATTPEPEVVVIKDASGSIVVHEVIAPPLTGARHVDIEDIVAVPQDILDDLIKAKVLINRALKALGA